MTTTLWSDTVDTIDDVWSETVGNNDPTPVYPSAYNHCIMEHCPACRAPSLAMCLNSVTQTARRVPCLARVTAANARANA